MLSAWQLFIVERNSIFPPLFSLLQWQQTRRGLPERWHLAVKLVTSWCARGATCLWAHSSGKRRNDVPRAPKLRINSNCGSHFKWRWFPNALIGRFLVVLNSAYKMTFNDWYISLSTRGGFAMTQLAVNGLLYSSQMALKHQKRNVLYRWMPLEVLCHTIAS